MSRISFLPFSAEAEKLMRDCSGTVSKSNLGCLKANYRDTGSFTLLFLPSRPLLQL